MNSSGGLFGREERDQNLPVRLASFVGWERDIAEIIGGLATTHLLVLTGPGGTGKTSPVIQAASQLSALYRDAVTFQETWQRGQEPSMEDAVKPARQ